MLESGTNPESYITEYTLVYEKSVEIIDFDFEWTGRERTRGPRKWKMIRSFHSTDPAS